MEILQHLKNLKEKKGYSNAKIAELSNVPLPTVNKVYSGDTPNPSFETVARITIALGGSLDVIAGIKSSTDEPALTSPVVQTIESYSELLKEKDERIKEKNEIIRQTKKALKIFAFFTAAIIFLLVCFVIFDALNGHLGFFRY